MKVSRIAESNLSAITDEKGDLLFDRDRQGTNSFGAPLVGGITAPYGGNRRTDSWIKGTLFFLGKMAVFIGVIVLIVGAITGRLALNTLFPGRNSGKEMTAPVPKAQKSLIPETIPVQTEKVPYDQLKIKNVIVSKGLEGPSGLKEDDIKGDGLHYCMDFEGAVPWQTKVRVDWYKGVKRVRKGVDETLQTAIGRTCSSLQDNLIEGVYEAKIIANNLHIKQVPVRIIGEPDRVPDIAAKKDYTIKTKNRNSDAINIPENIRSSRHSSMQSHRPPVTIAVQKEEQEGTRGYSAPVAKQITPDDDETGRSRTADEGWKKARELATYEDQ